MKFTEEDLKKANAQFQMLEFYPSSPTAQAAIMALLAKMCPSREALEWLTEQMVNKVGKWHGPKELRGVLCWQYRPADGVNVYSSISGFSPEDGERLEIEQQQGYRQIEESTKSLLRQLLSGTETARDRNGAARGTDSERLRAQGQRTLCPGQCPPECGARV